MSASIIDQMKESRNGSTVRAPQDPLSSTRNGIEQARFHVESGAAGLMQSFGPPPDRTNGKRPSNSRMKNGKVTQAQLHSKAGMGGRIHAS
jgi:hypothetical protein